LVLPKSTVSWIIGNTELALFETAKGTKIEDNLREIYSSSMRAKERIKQILGLSRHSVNIDKPIPIGPPIKEALKMLRSVIPTSIEFRENITSEQLVAKADPTQIHQLVVNLAINAIQAMTDGFGVLEIRLKRVDFSEEIKAIRSEVPVIICTGFSEKIEGKNESLDIEAILMKPTHRLKF
jgi:signal transduction histidine kinase